MHLTDKPYIDYRNALYLVEQFILEIRGQYGELVDMQILIMGGGALAL